MQTFPNPFRPGAGQPPPYLAGREKEADEFTKLLHQDAMLKNLVITGLRGVGKTVLLESFRPIASQNKWLWAGTDLSEQVSVSEQNLSIRIMTDLAALASAFTINIEERTIMGFYKAPEIVNVAVNYATISSIYNSTPGLETDKLKRVLEVVWDAVKDKVNGIVLAYDEAQILKDKAADKQYPLSLLLEVIQYIQRKGIPYLLVLTGLPTLVSTLSETRTYSERMFQIMTLGKLNEEETKKAVLLPIETDKCPVTFNSYGISEIIKYSGGYPYFIQFFCKEIFDSVLQQIQAGIETPNIKVSDYQRKLDNDFYASRWSRVTDRQRDLLLSIAQLANANEEFSTKEVSEKSEEYLNRTFSSAYVVTTLSKLIEAGLLFKNRRGKYSFAVPMLADYINRSRTEAESYQSL